MLYHITFVVEQNHAIIYIYIELYKQVFNLKKIPKGKVVGNKRKTYREEEEGI